MVKRKGNEGLENIGSNETVMYIQLTGNFTQLKKKEEEENTSICAYSCPNYEFWTTVKNERK